MRIKSVVPRLLVGVGMAIGQVAGLLILQKFRDPTLGYRGNTGVVLSIAAYLVGPPILALLGARLLGGRAVPKRGMLTAAFVSNLILGILGHGLEDAGMTLQGYLVTNFAVMLVVGAATMPGRADGPDGGAV
jgi:hypothetical protein